MVGQEYRNDRRAYSCHLILLPFICALSCSEATSGDSTKSDRGALARIFNDFHTVDAALPVHRRAAQMPVRTRYEYLTDWVLPNDDHATFRLVSDFTPTNPAAPFADAHPVDARRLDRARGSGDSRIQLGGHLVSPAIDLIEAAQELDCLDQLREQVEKTRPAIDAQQRCRITLLALIDIARRDFESAKAGIEELHLRAKATKSDPFQRREPETLAILHGLRHRETRGIVGDLLYFLLECEVRPHVETGERDAWKRWMAGMEGRLSYLESRGVAGGRAQRAPSSLAFWCLRRIIKPLRRNRINTDRYLASTQIPSRTRPLPLFRLLNKPAPNRIHMDVVNHAH